MQISHQAWLSNMGSTVLSKYTIQEVCAVTGAEAIDIKKMKEFLEQLKQGNIQRWMKSLFIEIERWDLIVENILVHPDDKNIINENHLPSIKNSSVPMFLWGAEIIYDKSFPKGKIILTAEIDGHLLSNAVVVEAYIDLKLSERMLNLLVFT